MIGAGGEVQMLNKVLSIVFIALLLISSPALAESETIQNLTAAIGSNPEDKHLYKQRAYYYDLEGDHKAALNDVLKSCTLEYDEDDQLACEVLADQYELYWYKKGELK